MSPWRLLARLPTSRCLRHQAPLTWGAAEILLRFAGGKKNPLTLTVCGALLVVFGAVASAEHSPPRTEKARPGVTFKDLFEEHVRPLEDPRCATLEGAAFTLQSATEAKLRFLWGAVFSLVPHLGYQYGTSGGASFALSWPWSLPFGPASAEQVVKRPCSEDRFVHRPNRLVLEPGFVLTGKTTFFFRPGYRFVWHPRTWPFGFGAGVGSTVELRGEYGVRASLSPELLLSLGACCEPFYAIVSVRYDRFFTDVAKDVLLVKLGITYF